MDNNSAILAHDAFDTWTMLYLNSNHKGYPFDFNIQQAVKRAATDGYQKLYFGCGTKQLNGTNCNPKTAGHESNNITE